MYASQTSPDTRARYVEVAEALAACDPGVIQAKMFGMPSLKANGKAFAGLFGARTTGIAAPVPRRW